MRTKSEIKVDNEDTQPDENTYMLYNSIEENFRKRSVDSVGCLSVIPCFYKLLDDKQAVNDAPKLDGLVSYVLISNFKNTKVSQWVFIFNF